MPAPSRVINQTVLIAVLTALVACTLFPFAMLLLISQKTNGEIHQGFFVFPAELRLEYYTDALKFVWRYMLNSVIVGVSAVAGVVFLSSLGGYVFGRLDFAGKRVLFMLLIGLIMIPGILTLIPAYLWYKNFPFVGGNGWMPGAATTGFLNTRLVLILPYITGGQIMGIFLCRTFVEQIPKTLFEAARIDGAGEFKAYFYIALPLSLPILATVGIMSFVGSYNDYIWPLITISETSLQVFAVGVTKFGLEGNLDYGPQMAGYVIGSIPLIILFSFGMKYYVQGLLQGGIKA